MINPPTPSGVNRRVRLLVNGNVWDGRKVTLGGGGVVERRGATSPCRGATSPCRGATSPPPLQGDIRRPREGSTGVWDSLHPPEATYNIHILHENRKVSKLVREKIS